MSDRDRPEISAEDYFRNQKKKAEVADRRPVIRRPSDLVGPGISAHATRITDFNDALATFNGFFSSAEALNAPSPDPVTGLDDTPYVGWVASDSELGGVQLFTDLVTGDRWQRTFRRNPLDAGTLYWGAWASV